MTEHNGNQLTDRFGPGRVLTETTDALGQAGKNLRAPDSNLLTQRTDLLEWTTRYPYDASGNVISRTDLVGQVWTATYEPLFNQPLITTDPLGQTTRFTYDATGNLAAVTDPPGHTTTVTHDPNGSLLIASARRGPSPGGPARAGPELAGRKGEVGGPGRTPGSGNPP